jgi:hypothetical protein
MSTPPSFGPQGGPDQPPSGPLQSGPSYPPGSPTDAQGQGYGQQGGYGQQSGGYGQQGDFGQQPPPQPSSGYGAPGGSGPQQGGIFAQEPPKKKGPGKWIAIGCGGCAVLVLIVLLVVGLLWHFGGGFEPDDDVPTPTASSQTPSEDQTPSDEVTADDEATTDDETTDDEATTDDETTDKEATTDDDAEDTGTGDGIEVTFEVETDGGHSLVTYSAPDGEIEQKWFDEKKWSAKQEFDDSSDLIGVNMNVIPGEGKATCRIIIDGEVVDEKTDEDVPTCMVPVDYEG